MTQMHALRATPRRIENKSFSVHEVMPFGVSALDRKLLGGGMAFGCLHEVMGAGAGIADAAASALFIAGILARTKGRILWYVSKRDLFTPVLNQVGLDMARVVFVEVGDEKKVLACMENALRQGGVTAVVGELGSLSMNESRRLQLAAEQSGAMGVVLRRWSKSGEAAVPLETTVSRTRWRLTAASHRTSYGAASSRWRLELMQCRDGEYHVFDIDGCDEDGYVSLTRDQRQKPALEVVFPAIH